MQAACPTIVVYRLVVVLEHLTQPDEGLRFYSSYSGGDPTMAGNDMNKNLCKVDADVFKRQHDKGTKLENLWMCVVDFLNFYNEKR